VAVQLIETVRIKGPRGGIAVVPKSEAEAYLKMEGYSLLAPPKKEKKEEAKAKKEVPAEKDKPIGKGKPK